jgi:membrane protease YdiL (CAAX protease family)
MERLDRRDWIFIAVCAAVAALSLFVTLRFFSRAFPEASIEFKYDRAASRAIALRSLAGERVDVRPLRHTAVFDADDDAKIFLERSLGLEQANRVLSRQVRVWYWHHRWFRPLDEEEYSVDVAPTGEIVAFSHKIPEDRAAVTPDPARARLIAEDFLTRSGVDLADLQLVTQSERRLPRRLQRIFTWDSKTIRPAGAPWRTTVVVDGSAIGSYSRRLRVPESWQRSYRELRSKNLLAGGIDVLFLGATMVAALVVFIVRLRRGDLHVRFLLGVALACVVLVTGVTLNSYPSVLAGYETTSSYPAFVAQLVIFALLQSIGTAMLLVVVCGAGEVLYREEQPSQLAMPRLFARAGQALRSKRVFRSFVLAYTLVAFFLGYQVVFYLTAAKFGAWSPAEIPYDDILNTALPWVAVLFAGFFPAMSEEFLSRAFSIPLLRRLLRSRAAAIVVAGFIWGFGHATYPNQPFYIRGIEVGLAGVVIGLLYEAFGLLPLLIWHYTVDALYTALLLFRSHNTYYILSAGVASLIFAIPMLASIVLYLRHGGFAHDDSLNNATLPLAPPPALPAEDEQAPLPPATAISRGKLAACAASIVLLIAALTFRPAAPSDAIDYRTSRAEAKRIAVREITARGGRVQPRVIAAPVEGFRRWDRDSSREDGGSPGGFDSVAASYLVANGVSIPRLVDLFRHSVQAATWSVRSFAPMQKEETFVEVDPRSARAIGYHKYQDERAPGPSLDQASALAIAQNAFRAYGLDASRFELKEALSFQQPARRDWLFHFDERTPVAAGAFRRITVRVSGKEMTQFATTIRIPEAVERAASTRTVVNVVLMILRIAGAITALALVVGGFVIAAVRRRPRWRRVLRLTLPLLLIPIIDAVANREESLFGYNTSVQWQTFAIGNAVQTARDVAVSGGMLFLALAALDSIVPFGMGLLRREGRARFGRSATVAALTAVALLAAARLAMPLVTERFPAAARISLDVSNEVAIPLPALVAAGEAVTDALAGAAAVAALSVALERFRRRRWIADAIVVFVLFTFAVDPGATADQTPLMLLRAASQSLVIWALARFVLARNHLSWPLAIFLATLFQSAAGLAQNHRADLQANAIALLAVAALVILWLVAARRPVDDSTWIVHRSASA